MAKKKFWYEYLWITSLLYLSLGFFNILFAWLGLLCFLIPLIMSFAGGKKGYCNRYCGRGQLFSILGKRLSLNRPIPKWIYSKWFRYGFLTFFMAMFINMLFSTYLVFAGAKDLNEVITVLWSFSLPWNFASSAAPVANWVKQFAFGFYSVMLTSTLLGFVTMILFRPRTWCVYCPMGTMTQLVCKAKYKE
ncbi:4Fe-4S binding protein [Anaerotignum sp. MB30-C6]|uniref:4Fe-4S binding protein n=1 Tax=Anaerotignum sp. MB30-C6 TaxID=3070814 RepID=UPI0027DE9726|nr:4Fe-4S binding protein [Anaerotignum sp. MB30-C6]WMI81130.1 4Fe-4S binding protein [Anaerotignum sp. MB30-C6]